MNSRTSDLKAVVGLGLAVRQAEDSATGIQELNPLLDRRWESFIQRHPNASVFHSTSWLSALNTAYGYEPIVISASVGSSELDNALVFCRIKSWLTGTRLVALPFSDHCEPLVNDADEIGRLLGHVQRRVDAKQSRYFEIRPLSFEPAFQTALTPGNSYRFHSLNLRRGTDEIFRAFHKDCIQRKIRRAEREGLKYDEGNSDELLRKFYRLMVMTRRRQGLPPQPLKWFQALISVFRDQLKIRVASKDNVAVASILTLTHKKSMVYKYGCSDAAANKFGGMPLLFWKAIQDAKNKNCEELDMGRSDLDNQGLTAFKGHLGADARVIQYWTYPARAGSKNNGWKVNAVGRIVSASPDWMVKAAGSVLYRHIG